MNIFLRELRAHRRSLIYWSIGMLFMIWAGMTKFGAYEKSGQPVNELFKGLPKGLAAVFGVGNIDLTKAVGFYAILFLYLIVMASIHASLLGAGILADEERDKTAEFLYTKPISRAKVITEKLLAALTLITMLNIVTLLSSIFIVDSYNKRASVNKEIILMMIGMFVVQIIFISIGMAAAAVVRKPKRAAVAVSTIMFSTFFLSLWLDMTEKLPWLKYFTPFKYFDGKEIVNNIKLDPVYIVISVGIIIFMICLTYVFYQKRDLSI